MTSYAQVKASPSSDDLVHFGDVIDVDVVGGFEFDWRGTLTPDGSIDGLEGIEPIPALCRAETEIAGDIAKAYSKILRDPHVIVRIIDRSNRALARVEGAVKTPTRFRLRRETTLRELLVLAGGITEGANGDISIFRPRSLSCDSGQRTGDSNNGLNITNIKISDLISGKPGADARVLSGDIVTVAKALPVYVIGAVNNPNPLFTRPDLTVTRAIAIAGGLARDADGRRVSVFRRDGGETRSIEIDLEKIKKGLAEDEILKPFDILDVAAKGRGDRKYPPVAAPSGRERSLAELPLRVVD